jgi:hypothetical protein
LEAGGEATRRKSRDPNWRRTAFVRTCRNPLIDRHLSDDFRQPLLKPELLRPQLERPIIGGWQPPKDEDFARNQAKAHRAKAKYLRWQAAELRRKAGELDVIADQQHRMGEKVGLRSDPLAIVTTAGVAIAPQPQPTELSSIS